MELTIDLQLGFIFGFVVGMFVFVVLTVYATRRTLQRY